MYPFCWLGSVQKAARKQELFCDAYAAKRGYGEGMLEVINLYRGGPESVLYPTTAERREHLEKIMKGSP